MRKKIAMANDKESFRAGTKIRFRRSSKAKPILSVCHVYHRRDADSIKRQFAALSLNTGRCGYGSTPDDAYADLLYKLVQEYRFCVANNQEYQETWHAADAGAVKRARAAHRIDSDRHRQLLKRVQAELIAEKNGPIQMAATSLDDTMPGHPAILEPAKPNEVKRVLQNSISFGYPA